MTIDFDKYPDGLVPAIVQDPQTKNVLMLGFMNKEAVDQTLSTGRVTFFSRTKKRLWTKGETSNNYLNLVEIKEDCDNDTLLVKAKPEGPVCHTGADTCFNEDNSIKNGFIDHLEKIISDRKENPAEKSYTSELFKEGINKIAQKVGEEAVELVIESKDNNDDKFLNEAADLLYHYLVLIQARNFKFSDVVDILEKRHQ
jgi:phosphoribosyl-ATP pyrophosphohydrolase/phosphoribosyl-AMP cyclohydrolase